MPTSDPNLRLAPTDDGITSDWTTKTASLHFHDYRFDDYGTEVISLEAGYADRADVKALDWETTHRSWTGDAWELDFAALDTAVAHLVERGHTVTVAAPALTIFRSDYEAPFLEAHLPAAPPPGSGPDAADGDDEVDLTDF